MRCYKKWNSWNDPIDSYFEKALNQNQPIVEEKRTCTYEEPSCGTRRNETNNENKTQGKSSPTIDCSTRFKIFEIKRILEEGVFKWASRVYLK